MHVTHKRQQAVVNTTNRVVFATDTAFAHVQYPWVWYETVLSRT